MGVSPAGGANLRRVIITAMSRPCSSVSFAVLLRTTTGLLRGGTGSGSGIAEVIALRERRAEADSDEALALFHAQLALMREYPVNTQQVMALCDGGSGTRLWMRQLDRIV
jgi:hypothetical protein